MNPKSMNRKLLFTLALLFLFTLDTLAQQELGDFNQERLQVNKVGMIVLGGWALANFGTNGVLLSNPSSNEQGHFYRMNIFWNVVNLGLAISGLRHSLITDPSTLNLAETVGEYHQMGKVLLMNAGLEGIDRIVPVGRAVEMDIWWDGYDIISSLSRRIDIQ